MKITDNTGREIIITNLDAAIRQAQAFAGYCHADGHYAAFDAQRRGYWTDLLKKLQDLKSKKNGNRIF